MSGQGGVISPVPVNDEFDAGLFLRHEADPARVEWVRSSGPLLASALVMRGRGLRLRAKVFPGGVIFEDDGLLPYWRPRAVYASEIHKLRTRRVLWWGEADLINDGVDVSPSLMINADEDSDVVTAIRQIMANPIAPPPAPAPPVVHVEPGRPTMPLISRAAIADRPKSAPFVGFLPPMGPDEWLLQLPGWVLASHNEQLGVGESHDFAIRVTEPQLLRVKASGRSADPVGGGWYDLRGEAVFVSDDLTVLDFGLAGFIKARPNRVSLGEIVKGRAGLEIDLVEYAALLAPRTRVPDVVRTWLVTGLWRRAPGYRAPIPNVGVTRIAEAAEPERFGFVPIDSTAAFADDSAGLGFFLVRARLVAAPPGIAASA